jgi:hypothetical protein
MALDRSDNCPIRLDSMRRPDGHVEQNGPKDMARDDVTGKKPTVENQIKAFEHPPRGSSAKLAYSIIEFCALHGISRAHYYNLKTLGLGPIEMHCGGRKLISVEAAADWRRAREAAITPV